MYRRLFRGSLGIRALRPRGIGSSGPLGTGGSWGPVSWALNLRKESYWNSVLGPIML